MALRINVNLHDVLRKAILFSEENMLQPIIRTISQPLFATLLSLPAAACSRGGHPHAGARRRFRRQAHRAPSLAHVLRVFHRHRVLLPGTATSLPRLVTRIKRTFYPSPLAAGIADFLAIPSSLHKCIQENVDATRGRC